MPIQPVTATSRATAMCSNTSGRIIGGTPEQAGAGLIATHAEVRALEPRVADLGTRTDEWTVALEDARQKVRGTAQELDECRADLHAQELAVLTVERDVKSHEAEQVRLEVRLDALEKELAEVEGTLAEGDREDQALEATYREALSRLEAAREGMATQEAEAHRVARRSRTGQLALDGCACGVGSRARTGDGSAERRGKTRAVGA